MSDLFDTWQANGASGFGTLTQAILATQNETQFSQVGVVVTQEFLRALVTAATNNGSA
jgi:hypothetical protein